MPSSISGSISFAGLGNGTDFAEMIKGLKSIEEIPKKRLESWQKDWQQRYEAFDTLFVKIKELQETLSKTNMAALLKKEVSSSTPAVATAKADGKAIDTSHSIDVSQLASNAVLTNNTIFSSKDILITEKTPAGDTPKKHTFSYDYKGKTYNVEVGDGAELQTLVDKINKDTNNPGVTASLVKSGNGYLFQMQGKETGSDASLKINPSTSTSFPKFGNATSVSGSLGVQTDTSGTNTIINNNPAGGDKQEFIIYYTNPKDGLPMSQTITLSPGATAKSLAEAINTNAGETGVVASFSTDPTTNEVTMRLESTSGKPVVVQDSATNPVDSPAFKDANFTNTTGTGDGWTQRVPQDAKFTVDGIPRELTSATNTLTEVFEGLTVTLISEGKTNLTVSTSTEGMKTKIEDVVKETNELLAKIQELTKVSSDKKQESITNEDGTPNYGSQSSFQMGSVLTGNYGVQLLSSRLKSTLSSTAVGFKGLDANSAGKPIPNTGDLFTSLGSIGIMFDAEQGSPTYGQLKFLTEDETTKSHKTSKDETEDIKIFRTLDEALKEDPLAVADLLVGSGGFSDSPDFSYRSHISGTTNAATKPGAYKVSYDVKADGTIGKVFINGVEAVLDTESLTPNLYEVTSGAAKGMAISINNLDPGTHNGTIRIKQGKITQLTGMLTDEMAAEEIKPGSPSTNKRGSLVILKDNYKSIMKNIQEKIDKETERIAKWEKTQKLKFARLDALLGKYDQQMNANASSFAQLSSGK